MQTVEDRVYVVGCDVDNTLVPAEFDYDVATRDEGLAALSALCQHVRTMKQTPGVTVYFGGVTGRIRQDYRQLEQRIQPLADATAEMDFLITGVGTEIGYIEDNTYTHDETWPFVGTFNTHAIHGIVHASNTQLQIEANTTHKLSYIVEGLTDETAGPYIEQIRKRIGRLSMYPGIIFSSGQYLDILPRGVNKGSALRHVARHFMGDSQPFVIAAGDSMNDSDMLTEADRAILPSNAHPSLRQWAIENIPEKQLYIAASPFARGVLEGLGGHR